MHSNIDVAGQACAGVKSPSSTVGPLAPPVPNPLALFRVGEVLQAFAAARAVSDAELRQHAMDCTHLMEVAYGRYQAHQIAADREEAVLWMHRRDEALRIFSRRGQTFVELGR
jgi:hypothetical protein